MNISNLSQSPSSVKLASDSSGRLSKVTDEKKSSVEASQSSFLGDLSSFLGKAISGGLTVASAASSLAIPGASLGISKLGEAAAGSLLHGFMSSTLSNTAPEMGSALAAVSGDSGQRMMAHQVYQHNQLISSPGASFLAKA